MIVRIVFVPDRQSICRLSRQLFQKFNLSEQRSYVLKAGHRRHELRFIPDNTQRTLTVPASMKKKLLLPPGLSTVNVWIRDSIVHLGPVVGIFVNPRDIQDLKLGYIPKNTIKDVQANNKAKCIIYYFTVGDVDFEQKTIRGCVLAPSKKRFKTERCPFPDVIYDCGVKFDPQHKAMVKEMRQRFHDDPETAFINNKDYLGKWSLYRKLNEYEEISSYLPETIRYNTFTDVSDMLDRHSHVFVKSFYGSRAREVMSIRRVQDRDRFVLHYYDYRLKRELVDRNTLQKRIELFTDDRKCIVQQGISLLSYKKRRFDMRILMAKDESGMWRIIYNQANLAPRRSMLTTIKGECMNYKKIYQAYRKHRPHFQLPTDQDVRNAALTIAGYIEKSFGSFGELGIDLAIDNKGKIRFFEANTKPEKYPIHGLENTVKISPQYLAVFLYAKYLAKKIPTFPGIGDAYGQGF
jgi:hypothetical protein